MSVALEVTRGGSACGPPPEPDARVAAPTRTACASSGEVHCTHAVGVILHFSAYIVHFSVYIFHVSVYIIHSSAYMQCPDMRSDVFSACEISVISLLRI